MDGHFIITGSAQGFGKEFTRRVLSSGGKVVLADNNNELGVETCSQFQNQFGTQSCLFLQVDVTKKEDWESLWKVGVEFLENVDVLVNNAGVSPSVGWDKCMQVNLDGVLHGCRLFNEKVGKKTGDGRGGLVVNIASMAGLVTGAPEQMISYVISKHGVVSATRSLGEPKLANKTGVKYVGICPWFAETNILAGSDIEKLKKLAFDFVTVEKVGEAFEEVVNNQKSGATLAVLPSCPLIYYPDTNHLSVSVSVYLLARFTGLLGIQVVRPVHFYLVLILLILAIIYLAHVVLGVLGL